MPGNWNTGFTCLTVTLLVVIFLTAMANAAAVSKRHTVSKRLCPSRSVGCGGVCGANMVCVKNCLRMCAITKRSGGDERVSPEISEVQKELWMPKQPRRLETSLSNQCILDDILENLSPEWKLDILNMYKLAIESTLDNADEVSEEESNNQW